MSFANIDVEAQNKKTELVDSTSNLSTATSQKLSSFVGLVSKLDKAQSQLGTKRDDEQLRQNTEQLVRQCNLLETQLNKHLADLSTGLLKEDSAQLRYTEDKLRKESSAIFNNYHRILRKYEEKLKSVTVAEQYRKNTQRVQSRPATEQSEETTPLLQEQTQVQQQVEESALSQAELDYHNTLLEQRSEAVSRIQEGVEDINAIFKDLGAMVRQQGQQVDTIEDNLLTYANNNQAASHELTKADEYQKKKKKISCVMLVLVTVVLLITLAIIN